MYNTFRESHRTAFGNKIYSFYPTFDVFIELFQLNPKTSFGVGLGNSKYGSAIAYTMQAESLITSQGSSANQQYEGSSFSRTVTNNKYFSLFTKREIPIEFLSTRKTKSYLIGGITVHFLERHSPFIFEYSSNHPLLTYESISRDYSRDFGKFKNINIGVVFRYEYSIYKKDKNLLNLNLTYHQGFLKSFFIEENASVYFNDRPEIPQMKMLSYSRGSNFSIGISKTFSLPKKSNKSTQ